MSVLSRSDIERMKNSVKPPVVDDYKSTRRATLKELSESRQKNWPNTLEALRKNKESFTRDREAQEELIRQEIDREEAELRKTMRLESIRRANELLYDQTDKMKMLKSQKLYADVIHERVSQVQERKRAEAVVKNVEADYHQVVLQQVADGNRVEQEKLEKQKKLMANIAVSRHEQVAQARLRAQEQERELAAIGAAMKAKAKEQLDEEIVEFEERKKMLRDRNAQTLIANEKLIMLRREMAAKEREAEIARDAEIEAIEDRKRARKVIEIRRFEKQQLKRQQLIDIATKKMSEIQSRDNELLCKQIMDANTKEEIRLKLKKEKADDEWQKIIVSRSDQVVAKAVKVEQEKLEEAKLLAARAARHEEETRKELEKSQREAVVIKQLKKTQLVDAAAVRRQKDLERIERIEQEKFVRQMIDQDDQKFTEICKKEIANYSSQGKPVYTLLRALEHTAPDLLGAKLTKQPHPHKAPGTA